MPDFQTTVVSEIETPADAVWFGLEVDVDTDEPERCDDSAMGGKWWKVGVLTPQAVASAFGPGVYRAIWTKKDRRTQIGLSLPFAPHPPPDPAAATNQPPPAPDAHSHPAPQQQQREAAGPDSAGPDSADPEPTETKPAAKRKSNGRSRATTDMPTMPIEALTADTLHPLGQTIYLNHLAQAQSDKLHHLLLQGMQMMVANERARSQEHVANVAAHYQEMDKVRTAFMAQTMALLTRQSDAPPGPPPELAQLTGQLAKLAEQVDDIADGNEEDREQLLARLSENPNDLERSLAAFQNIVGALANSPLGEALAQKLQQGAAPIDTPE